MQYLVHCLDRSYCVLFERSILVKKTDSVLGIGESVKFLWPEDSLNSKTYSGIIVAKDPDEDILLDIMKHLSKEQELKGRSKSLSESRTITTKTRAKGTTAVPQQVSSLTNKPRKKPPTLLENEIQEEINKKTMAQQNKQLKEKSIESNWIADLIGNVKTNVNSDLQNLKTKVFGKLDFLQTSLLQKENCPTLVKGSVSNVNEPSMSVLDNKSTLSLKSVKNTNERRSFGMPKNNDSSKYDSTSYKRCRSPEELSNNEKSNKKNRPTDSLNEVQERDLITKQDDNLKIIETIKRRSVDMNVIVDNNDQSSENDDQRSEKDVLFLQSLSFEKNVNKIPISDSVTPMPSTSKQLDFINTEWEHGFENFNIQSPVKVTSEDESSSDLEISLKKGFFSVKPVIYSSEEEANTDKENKHDNVKKSNAISKNSEMVELHLDNSEQPSKKICDEKSSKDTTWTLRHHAKTSEISELIKDLNIFVNDYEKKKALDICKNQNELARALMKIVFTETALTKCSLFGKKPKGLGKKECARPGLHPQAVDAILIYVKRVGEKNGWAPKDRQLVIKSMTAKLNEMKSISEENYI